MPSQKIITLMMILIVALIAHYMFSSPTLISFSARMSEDGQLITLEFNKKPDSISTILTSCSGDIENVTFVKIKPEIWVATISKDWVGEITISAGGLSETRGVDSGNVLEKPCENSP